MSTDSRTARQKRLANHAKDGPQSAMRCAAYARYSSENQKETSIEDQFRLADRRAERENLTITLRFSDKEISASVPTLTRSGGLALMQAIRAGAINVLIIESLDRCWRDILDQERTIREIEFRGVRVIGIFDGYDSQNEGREMQRGFIGVVNQEFLRALARKTHRGLSGQVTRRLFAGGLPYGYTSIEVPGGRDLRINPEQAKWVLWIYERYADGWPIRKITHELNRLGIPSPRGSTWSIYAVLGSREKQTGILNCALYGGRYIWNKSQWIKNPDTGIRARRERPASDWLIVDRPDLRIVPDILLRTVGNRRQARNLAGGGTGKGARPKTLLGGILRCGECGGAVVAVSKYLYGCAARKDRGVSVCKGVSVPRIRAESRILTEIRAELLSPAFLAGVQAEIRTLLAQPNDTRHRAALQRDVRNLTQAVAEAGWSKALGERLRAAETALANLPQASRRHPVAAYMAQYKRLLADLGTELKAEPDRARHALKELIGEIKLVKEGPEVWAEIEHTANRLLMVSGMSLGVVAGGRYPTHLRFRLR